MASGDQIAEICLSSRQMDQPRTSFGFAPIAGAVFQYMRRKMTFDKWLNTLSA